MWYWLRIVFGEVETLQGEAPTEGISIASYSCITLVVKIADVLVFVVDHTVGYPLLAPIVPANTAVLRGAALWLGHVRSQILPASSHA